MSRPYQSCERWSPSVTVLGHETSTVWFRGDVTISDTAACRRLAVMESDMKISMQGWARDRGPREVASAALAGKAVRKEGKQFHLGVLGVSESGEVVFDCPTSKLAMNGKYLLRIRLSKADIAALVRAAYSDAPFIELVTAIRDAGPRPLLKRRSPDAARR